MTSALPPSPVPPPAPPPDAPAKEAPGPGPSLAALAPEVHPWRRFWARQLDYGIAALAAVIALAALAPEQLGRLVEASETQLAASQVAVTFAWAFVEAALLAAGGTTPGKWVVGIRVVDAGGGLAGLGASLRRSLGVWLAGSGLGLPVVSLFTWLYGYAVLSRGRPPVWDRRAGTGVAHVSRSAGRVWLAAGLTLALGTLWAAPELLRAADAFTRTAAREALERFEDDVRERAREEGIRVDRRQGPRFGSDDEGAWSTVPLAIDRPGHYAVLAACDDDCTNLDLGLRLPDTEDWFADDTMADAVPMVAFEVAAPQRFELDVVMETCEVEPCAWAWELVQTSESVVYLWGPGEGTCFAVAPDGLLLTAYHVIEGARSIAVVREGAEEPTPAELVASDPDHDLAVLRTAAPTPDYLDLAAPESLRLGRRVFTLGFPARDLLGSEPKFSEGSVASTRGLGDETGFFQMSVPIQPGSSGGPVVDLDGRVVGVVNASAGIERFFDETGSLPQGVNWAASAAEARALFEAPPRRPPAPSREAAIDRVRAALCRVEVH